MTLAIVKRTVLATAIVAQWFIAMCASIPATAQLQTRADRLYVENKGQIGDQHGKPNRGVRYLIVRPGLNIQLTSNGFSYDSYVAKRIASAAEKATKPLNHRLHLDDSVVYSYHRVDIELVGANPTPRIESYEQSSDYLNFYTHITEQVNGDQGVTFVRGYSRVIYRDVWPGIDLEWLIDSQGNPEYQFMVRPGGDVRRIQLRYHGAQATELAQDAMMMQVSHGWIKERIPASFLATSKRRVDVRYRQLGLNTYGFDVSSLDMALASVETLIIDPIPERLWATYYGGDGLDEVRDVSVTTDGHVYISGYANSTNSIATAGTHASNASEGTSFVAKLTTAGTRVWGTYYGNGSSAFAVATSIANESVIVGRVNGSQPQTAASAGSFQEVYGGGGRDAFVAKFTAAGTRAWSTFYGGSRNDEALDVVVNRQDQVIVVGVSSSADNIATNGAIKAVNLGDDDGFVVKFSAAGQRLWGTYLGGPTNDQLEGVATAADGDIVVVGMTTSLTGVSTPGASQPVYGGGNYDGYVGRISTNGQSIWRAYCGGAQDDWLFGVTVTPTNDIVVAGSTNSADNIATAGVHQSAVSAYSDAFVCAYSIAGSKSWGTYYGGEGDDYLTDVDAKETGIYACGYTNSSTGIASIGTISETMNGVRDAMIVKLSGNGIRVWGTYYGGSAEERSGGVAASDKGDVYVAGFTESPSNISSSSAHQPLFGQGQRDGWLMRIRDNSCTPPAASTIRLTGSTCVGEVGTSTVSIPSAIRVRWTKPGRGIVLGGSLTDTSIKVKWTSPGLDTLRIRVMREADTTCYSDTTLIVSISPIPTPIIAGDTSVCENSIHVYKVSADTGRDYQWSVTARGMIQGPSTEDSVVVRWSKAANGTDTVRVRETIIATGCASNAIIAVRVQAQPKPVINGPASACESTRTVYRVTRTAGRTYQWQISSRGTIDGSASDDTVAVTWKSAGAGMDTVRVRETIVATGCFADAQTNVRVNPYPRMVIVGQSAGCIDTESEYSVSNASGYRLQWTLPTQAQLVGGTLTSSTIRIRWREVGKQSIGIRATVSSTGCTRDTAMIVDVGASPDVSLTGPSSLCLTDSKAKVYGVPAGEPGTVYTWTITPPAFGTITGGGASPEVTIDWQQRGSGTLRVSARSPNGCSRDSLITVTVQDSLSPSISSVTGLSACEGDTITLDAGSGYQSYAWYQGATVVGSSRYYQTTQASTYVVRVSNGGCAGSSAAVTTTINSVPTAVVSENPAGTLMVTTDVSQAQYQWYDAASTPWTPLAGATQATYVPSTSGSYGVEVTNVSTGCRRRSAPVQITIGPSPSDPVITSLTPSTTVCSGQSVTLRVRTVGGREPYVYQWSDGTALLASSDAVVTLTPTSASVSTVTVSCIVTDADGKRDTATMTVTVAPVPDAGITEGPTGTLNAEPAGAGQYQWLGADKTSLSGATSSTYQPSDSGTYYVVVTDQGCRDTSDAFVYTAAPPSTGLLVRDYDFGTLPIDASVNASGGHVGSVIVENRTGQYLELSGASTTGGAAFYVPEQWPRRINDGDTAEIAVRFIPKQQQAYVAQLNVTTNATYTGSSTIQGSGRDKRPREQPIQIALLPTREDVAPGDTIGVMVVVRSMAAPINQALRYRYRLQWDCRVLEPIVLPGVSYDTAGTYAIATVIDGQYQPGQPLIHQLRFRAKQAEVDTTSIRFVGAGGFTWLDNQDIITAAADTVIRVRLCRDGGPQLIGRTIPSRIVRATPMPANNALDIELDVQSPGTLELVAADGRRVIARDVNRAVSHIHLDVSSLSAGAYTLVLTTTDGARYRPVVIVP